VDAVRAFLFFRTTLIDSVIKVYQESNVPSRQTAEAFGKMYTFTDDILISLLQTFQALNASR
jgi:hypothetical protein